ncbi:MAG: hypothetical protein IPF99_30275 [Deltaproteobacteria bacterium]|nr:hypothetical protein [Deltaproteobacteria bacterium]
MIGRLNLSLGLALLLTGLGCSTLRDGPMSVPQDGEDVALAVDATATDEDTRVSPDLDAATMFDVRTTDTSRCPEGQSLCAGLCTDTNASAAHCGGCGRSCPTGRVCVAGACDLSCAAGTTACAGTCRDLRRDAMNCGACGQACVSRNATAACNAGVCAVGTCNPGAADCDSNVSNGCECAPAHGVPSCPGGRCVVASCEPSYGDCDHDSTNGCEVDLRGTATNCGAPVAAPARSRTRLPGARQANAPLCVVSTAMATAIAIPATAARPRLRATRRIAVPAADRARRRNTARAGRARCCAATRARC